ncbi:hypothetical protein I3843_Q005000 [Carya illinoinensis]|nr:hypothetical protein I3843_Q005000 [Carya illinoinensis]
MIEEKEYYRIIVLNNPRQSSYYSRVLSLSQLRPILHSLFSLRLAETQITKTVRPSPNASDFFHSRLRMRPELISLNSDSLSILSLYLTILNFSSCC